MPGIGTTVGPWGEAFSYEQGVPVVSSASVRPAASPLFSAPVARSLLRCFKLLSLAVSSRITSSCIAVERTGTKQASQCHILTWLVRKSLNLTRCSLPVWPRLDTLYTPIHSHTTHVFRQRPRRLPAHPPALLHCYTITSLIRKRPPS